MDNLPERDLVVGATRPTVHHIERTRTVNGVERRSSFVKDPATGALVLRPDLEVKFARAMRRYVRRLKLRLYLNLALLYLAKFRLQCTGAVLLTLNKLLKAAR